MPDIKELGRKVKAKYPGKYDDLADDDLGRRVKLKYPGAYDDFTDAPTRQPEGVFSSFQTGVAGPLLRNVVETAADLYNAPGETLERAGRAGLEFVSAFDPAGAAYEPTKQGQAERVAELNRRADERLPEPIQSMKQGMAIEEAKPRTRAGRIAGVAGSILGEVAFPTAPETAVANIVTAPFAGAAAKGAGRAFKAGVNAVRRTFGKGAAQIIEAEALPAARAEVQQSLEGAVPTTERAAVRAETGPAAVEPPTPISTPGPTAKSAPSVQQTIKQYEEAVDRISRSSLSPEEKGKALEQAIESIARSRRPGVDLGPNESMVQSRYPRQKGAPQMVMPDNPNPIQQRGNLPGEIEPQVATQAPAPAAGRVVTVGDKQYTLTPEQEARWIAEVDEPLARSAQRARDFERFGHGKQEAAKMRKGDAMRVAATKREIVGALTDKERAAIARQEATNYKGKSVTVDVGGQQVPATVEGMAFGRVRVKLQDGQRITVEPSQIGASVRGPSSTAAMNADFPPLLTEAEFAPQSFGVKRAPDAPYTESVGPSVGEAQAMNVGGPGASVTGPSASAPMDLNAAISQAAESVPKSVAQRTLSELAAIYHLPRTLLSSLDISAPFRQGSLLTIPPTQWVRAGRAGVRMFQAFSTKKYNQIVEAIAAHVDAPIADEAGLYLATKAGQGLGKAEEAFMSKYAGRIPLVKQSEQAYKTYLDSLRMDTFSKYKRVIDSQGLAPEQAQNAYKAAATWINYATGRGSLGQTIDRAMPALSTVIFSPRYVASRLNVLNPAYYAKNAATPAGRAVLKQQMGELVQYAGMVAGTMTLAKAAGADVGLNPNSPDFLKIRAGNWRYDTLAGLQQVMRLIYRTGGDIKNKIRGEKTQGPNALEISGNFLRSKLAPAPGAFVDFIKGRTVTGKDFKAGEAAIKLVAPIQWQDFAEAYQKEGWGGVVKASPGMVGFGVQQYDSKPVNAAIEKSQPLFTELQRLNKRVSDLRQKDGEKDDAFNARVRQFGQNYTLYGLRLLDSPRFKAAPDNVKAIALDSLNNRAKAITSREFALPEIELDANTIMDAAESSKKNPANK